MLSTNHSPQLCLKRMHSRFLRTRFSTFQNASGSRHCSPCFRQCRLYLLHSLFDRKTHSRTLNVDSRYNKNTRCLMYALSQQCFRVRNCKTSMLYLSQQHIQKFPPMLLHQYRCVLLVRNEPSLPNRYDKHRKKRTCHSPDNLPNRKNCCNTRKEEETAMFHHLERRKMQTPSYLPKEQTPSA